MEIRLAMKSAYAAELCLFGCCKYQKMAGTVPETVLKKRKRDEEWANKKTAAAAEAQKKARSSRKDILKRAESYVNEYRNKV